MEQWLEQDELSEAEIQRRILILIDALMRGHRLTYHRWTVCLDNAYQLCAVGQNIEGEEKLIVFNFGRFTLTDYMEWAQELSIEEIDAIVANVALNKA
jgi:hypothetical protein